MYQHLLVPLDDTPVGAELIGEAVDLARALGARITFLHVTGMEEGALYGEAEVLRAAAPQKFAEKFQWAARSVLSRAEMAARAAGVGASSMTISQGGKLHEAILSACDDLCADLIVMASHERSSRLAALVQSRAVAVMTRTRIPFLLAVPGVAGSVPMRRCVARLRDEHRTIAAVLEGMRQIAQAAGTAPLTDADRRILQASLAFMGDFAGTLHHPKEEQFLFAKCRGQSEEVTPLLDELAQQHAHEHALLERAQAALAGDPQALRRAIDDLAEHVWRHMRSEEEHVLPHARAVLADSDWLEVDAAFSGHTDPRFSTDSEQDLRSMYARLVNLFPH